MTPDLDTWTRIAASGEKEQLRLYCEYWQEIFFDIKHGHISQREGAMRLLPPDDLDLEYLELVPDWGPVCFELQEILEPRPPSRPPSNTQAQSNGTFEDYHWVGWTMVQLLREGLTLDVEYKIHLKPTGSRLVTRRVSVTLLEGDRVSVDLDDPSLNAQIAMRLSKVGPWVDERGERHPRRNAERMKQACEDIPRYEVEGVSIISNWPST